MPQHRANDLSCSGFIEIHENAGANDDVVALAAQPSFQDPRVTALQRDFRADRAEKFAPSFDGVPVDVDASQLDHTRKNIGLDMTKLIAQRTAHFKDRLHAA